MKKLVLGFVIAVSLMVGAAGSALATAPDDAACTALSGGAASTVLTSVAVFAGGCEPTPHGPS